MTKFISMQKTYFYVVLELCLCEGIPKSSNDPLRDFLQIFMLYLPGKILNDDTALKEYKIDEKNFVVVMVTKVSKSLFLKGKFLSLFFIVFTCHKTNGNLFSEGFILC